MSWRAPSMWPTYAGAAVVLALAAVCQCRPAMEPVAPSPVDASDAAPFLVVEDASVWVLDAGDDLEQAVCSSEVARGCHVVADCPALLRDAVIAGHVSVEELACAARAPSAAAICACSAYFDVCRP